MSITSSSPSLPLQGLGHFDLRELLSLSGVNRNMNRLTQDPTLWKECAKKLHVSPANPSEDSGSLKVELFKHLRVLRSQTKALKTRKLRPSLKSALEALEQRQLPRDQEILALFYESLKLMAERLPQNQVPLDIAPLSLRSWLEARDTLVLWKCMAKNLNLSVELPLSCGVSAVMIEKATLLPSWLQAEEGRISSQSQLELNDLCLSSLPNEWSLFQNLASLSLNFNQLRELPTSLFKLTQLVALSLHHNRLLSLPEELGHLKNLKVLNLNHNLLEKVPASLCHLTRLEVLQLSNNPLAQLPEKMGDLQNLRDIYLSRIRIKALPSSFTDLKALKIICLSYTSLEVSPPLSESLSSKTTVYIDQKLRPLFSRATKVKVILDPEHR